ncbi:hypothetical protein PIB30_062707 [Stylosanthes scabra]|uniref:Gag-pol polyprotein n=1 Tax=Stylosanthes scabra TaxID=79078 RepID=A0ABU6RLC1_9FABA|nr:hypothetical protein [Stylosanthes scabra]
MKVLMKYWKDLENESNSEDKDEQDAYVCFMANKEETEVADDLLEENRFLKSEIAKFKGKQLVSASMDLIAENERLCGVIEDLKQDLEQFTNNSNNLDKLLSYQRPKSMKSGLDYSAGSSANFETKFIKASASTSNTRNQQPLWFFHRRTARGNHCLKCNRQDHTLPRCFVVERKIGDMIYKIVCDFNALGQSRRTNIKGSK